jgi:NADP-dependent 3-hydroxy acid dehydrogenase YdfG
MSGHRISTKEEHFYACTKQAVRALTEGLRKELYEAGSQIRVAVSQPRFDFIMPERFFCVVYYVNQ